MDKLTPETLASLCQYGHSITEESVVWNGYKIKFQQDQDADSPHDRGDYMPPMIYCHCDGLQEQHGPDLSPLGPFDHIAANWEAIRDVFNISAVAMESDQQENLAHGDDLDQWRADYLQECLDSAKSEARGGYRTQAYLDTLAALYMLQGVPAFVMQTRGYSQGDWAAVLFIMTPDWAGLVGCPYATPGAVDLDKCKEDCAGSLKEVAAWMWGDVYGYTVTRSKSGRDVDSCWGFYGSDGNDSGIFESICENVNQDWADKVERRAAKQARKMEKARPDLAAQYGES